MTRKRSESLETYTRAALFSNRTYGTYMTYVSRARLLPQSYRSYRSYMSSELHP